MPLIGPDPEGSPGDIQGYRGSQANQASRVKHGVQARGYRAPPISPAGHRSPVDIGRQCRRQAAASDAARAAASAARRTCSSASSDSSDSSGRGPDAGTHRHSWGGQRGH